MPALPNAAWASAEACCQALASDRSLAATRMPLPPPPAVAFSSTGKPISRATFTASCSLPISPSLPGTVGTPASRANARAEFLSPTRSIASGVGPMKPMSHDRQTSAKWEFSERNP